MLVDVRCLHVSDRSSQRSSVSDDHAMQLPKSESLMPHKAHKLRFVSSVEFRHSSGNPHNTFIIMLEKHFRLPLLNVQKLFLNCFRICNNVECLT